MEGPPFRRMSHLKTKSRAAAAATFFTRHNWDNVEDPKFRRFSW